tara:strand:- start:96 stop:218 length:123 start_codon:yes stop_codon:yes gene_type:complete
MTGAFLIQIVKIRITPYGRPDKIIKKSYQQIRHFYVDINH